VTTPPRASVLVISGMHRSGTSLVASVLREAGAHMGDRLLGPDRGNPRGHFEDVDFVEFHQRVLFARGQHVRVAPDFAFAPSEAERREAAALVAARAGRPLWGWKDPRTALLLDFWHGLVPEAAYLFVYRHPLDVLLSLVRRADVNYLGLLEAVDAWCEYNRRVLAFRRRVPRTLLCHVQGVVEDGDAFGRLVRERLGVDLAVSGATVRALYRPDELQAPTESGAIAAEFARLCPEAVALLDALDAEADVAAARGAGPDPGLPAPGGGAAGGSENTLAPAARRAGLAAIVAEAVPEAYEALNAEWLAYADERERAVQWLRTQRQADLDEIARWQAECTSLRAWHEAQAGDHAREMAQWSSATAALQAAVRDLEAGKAWLEQQRQAAEADTARWQAECERLREWHATQAADHDQEAANWAAANAGLEAAVRDLEAGKAWLEQQRQAAEADAARWQAECERLREWHATQAADHAREAANWAAANAGLEAAVRELEAGKAWLEQQRQAAEADTARWQAECAQVRAWAASQAQAATAALQQWEQEVSTLRAGIAELERGRTWLEERNTGLQAEVDRWAGEHARLRHAHAQLESGLAWLEAQRAAQQAEIERWRAACAEAEAWARDREEAARRLARQLEQGASS
jgi:exonuclease VII small subunit